MSQTSPAPPPTPTSAPARPLGLTTRARVRRWMLWGLGALALLSALSALSLTVLMHSLGEPWLKERLLALVRERAGVELDYRFASLQDGVLDLREVVVRTPQPMRAHAPELLRVRSLQLRYQLRQLLAPHPRVASVRAHGVTLQVVLDEHGKSSFDALGKASEPRKEPATPPSRVLAEALADGVPVGALQITELALALVRTERGTRLDRTDVRGLALLAKATGAGLEAYGGTPEQPLEVVIEHAGAQHHRARGRLRYHTSLAPREASCSLQVSVDEQDFAQVAVQQLAQLEAKLQFDPARGQSTAEVAALILADGAATTRGMLRVPDQGPPTVEHAEGSLDPVRLLALARAWSPPLEVGGGRLTYRIDALSLDRPASSATVAIEGELRQLSTQGAEVEHAQLRLHGRPTPAGLQLEGELALDRARARGLRAERVRLALDGTQDAQGALHGELDLRFASLQAGATTVRQGVLKLGLRELWGASPRDVRGDVTLDARAAALEGAELRLTQPHLTARAQLRGSPHALTAELEVERVERAGRPLNAEPVHVQLTLRDVLVDPTTPARSTGTLHARAAALGLQLELEATRRDDFLDYTLELAAAQLAGLEPLLPSGTFSGAELRKLGLTLHSEGRVERPTGPEPKLAQTSELRLTAPTYRGVTARALQLQLHSSGTRARQELQGDLRVEGLALEGEPLGHEHITIDASVDRVAPALRLRVRSEKLPATLLTASLRFDGAQRALSYDVAAELAQLSSLSTLLARQEATAGFDPSELGFKLRAKGVLTGALERDPGGGLRLRPDLLASFGGDGVLDAEGSALRWAQGGQAIEIPAARWHVRMRSDGARRTVEHDLSVDSVEVAFGSQRFSARGIQDHSEVSLTGGLAGSIEHSQRLHVRELQQDIVPGYAVGELDAQVRARRDHEGMIKISELSLHNRAGGTKLSLHGAVELSADERRLSVRANLEQDLARLSQRDELLGKGQVAMDVRLSSPDFRLFHSAAKLSLDDVSVKLPGVKIALESVDGELPVQSDFVIDEGGFELLRGARINPYAAQRFADQHPLLGHRSFVSIGRISSPFVTLAPFAANLEVVGNIVSLSQIEMGVRGGTITGSGSLEYDGWDSKIDANVRASGVRSSHGEPFDGNAALVIGVGERSIEGRADILRIGRRHLTDLLELQDPLRADPSLNAIRRALRFGYPERVRLSFQHGFASAGVDFAGLARLLTVNDVRGIPIGPLMERVLGELESVKEEP